MKARQKVAYIEAKNRDLGLCQVCGQTANDIHHIVFRSHGGADIPENLICLCRYHHNQAHFDEKVWRDKLVNLNKKHYGRLTIKQLKGL